MKAITIKQPWAWAIIFAGKDIENRTWHTHDRGPLLIHAGAAYQANAGLRGESIHPIATNSNSARSSALLISST